MIHIQNDPVRPNIMKRSMYVLITIKALEIYFSIIISTLAKRKLLVAIIFSFKFSTTINTKKEERNKIKELK